MKSTSIIFFFLFSLVANCQNEFLIKGKIELLSKSKFVIVSGPSGKFKGEIQEDGGFKITGVVAEPGFATIRTDSSASDAIWLEASAYKITCKEIIKPGITGVLLRTPELSGPPDAEIYHAFTQQRDDVHGLSPSETMQMQRFFCISFLDSLYQYYPNSKTIPLILSSCQPFLGDEAALAYNRLLNKEQKKDENARQLENYFRRKEKMEKEKFFTDFFMTNNKGEKFRLSSLADKKLILIDFWSSDCLPCRQNHLRLFDLYRKYSSKGLEIISISLDENKRDWLKAIKKDKMSWVNVSELNGWKNSVAENYFISSIPFSVSIKGNRKIIGTEMSKAEIEECLK